MMQKACQFIVLIVIVSSLVTMAADVSISGKVTKTGGGALSEVTVSLAKLSGVSVKTDSDGKFVLSNVNVLAERTSYSEHIPFRIKGLELLFTDFAGPKNGNVSIYCGSGTRLFSIDFSDLALSNKSVTLPLLPQGFAILCLTLNGNRFTFPIIQVGANCYIKESGQSAGLLASSRNVASAEPAVDTLVAKKTGFTDKKTPIKSYALSDVNISMDSIVSCNAATLKEAGSCSSHKILIGTAISPARLSNSISTREFNYVTPENEMKWQNVEGSEGVFTYGSADNIVTWAQQNNIKVKGHCLVWHSQLASWAAQAKGKERVLGIMKKHIESVMGHFSNKLYAWDVVNEAILTDNDNGTGNARMRPSVFYTEIGPDYIEQAFKIARDYADSHDMKAMKLYYNDYSIDGDNDKSKFARTMIKGWVDKGVPVDGIGFQMHIGPPNNIPTAEAVRDNMQFYADLGLEVLISEWDINLCGNKVTKEQQLKLYHDITMYCVNQPKCTAITFWGINDSESWLNSFSGALCNGGNSQSLLFSNNQKKDTYTQVLNALNGK